MTALQASTAYGVGFGVSSFPPPSSSRPTRHRTLILAQGTTFPSCSLKNVLLVDLFCYFLAKNMNRKELNSQLITGPNVVVSAQKLNLPSPSHFIGIQVLMLVLVISVAKYVW